MSHPTGAAAFRDDRDRDGYKCIVWPRQAHAFANADMVVFVAEIRVGVLSAARETVNPCNLRGARQRGQNAEIGQISRREQDRVALAFGASDLAFELAIER